jgi:hypothetical protein
MFDSMYDALRDAHLVVYGKVESVEPGRISAICTHVFKGTVHITNPVRCAHGPVPLELLTEHEYLLLADREQGGPDYAIPDNFLPFEIPVVLRAPIAELLHEYIDLVAIPVDRAGEAMQRLALRLLASDIPFLECDGTKLAEQVVQWGPENMKKLLDMATGQGTAGSTLTDEPLHDLISVVIGKADTDTLETLLIHQLERDETDGIASRLSARSPEEVTVVMRNCIRRCAQEPDFLESLLRIVHSLDRTDLLDWFGKEFASHVLPNDVLPFNVA